MKSVSGIIIIYLPFVSSLQTIVIVMISLSHFTASAEETKSAQNDLAAQPSERCKYAKYFSKKNLILTYTNLKTNYD